jgi:hypothetical protein
MLSIENLAGIFIAFLNFTGAPLPQPAQADVCKLTSF